MTATKFAQASVDYQQTLAYYFTLHEVRFKLLGFLPIFTGGTVILLPHYASTAQQVATACFGLLVTLGLISYDQRNTQIYDRLVRRVRFLEREFGFTPLPGDRFGGPFHSRPPLQKVLGAWLVWHIQGLTIIYAVSLTAWVYLGLSALGFDDLALVLCATCAYLASHVLLRVVSSVHHRGTREIKRLMADH
mgnify:CR=1 FL=1